MKKIFVLLTIVLTMVTGMIPAQAEVNTIDVYVNGTLMVCDPPAMIYNQRTMIPLRAVSESLGWDAEWNAEKRIAYIIDNEKGIVIGVSTGVNVLARAIGENTEEIKIDTPPIMFDSRVFIPVRAVAEALGVSVSWEAETRSVVITTKVSEGFSYETEYGTGTDKGYESETIGLRFVNPSGFTMTQLNTETDSDLEMISTNDSNGARIVLSVAEFSREITEEQYIEEIKSASQYDSEMKTYFGEKVYTIPFGDLEFKTIAAGTAMGEHISSQLIAVRVDDGKIITINVNFDENDELSVESVLDMFEAY